MDQENVLTGGIDALYTMKENLLELEGYREQSQILAAKQDQLEKQIYVKEKAVTEEIAQTVKKRKSEVEDSYDEQMDKVKSRIKKAKAKRDKEKMAQVSERIKEETSDLNAEKIRLKEELRSVYEKNHIPRILNNSYYHALFMPRCLKDLTTIVITMIVILFVIPYGVYKLFLPQETFLLVIDYIITVILFGGLYLWINSKTKEKHSDAVIDIRAIRAKQAKNKKRIHAIEKDIRKDKDESTYSLEDFNNELQELDSELKAISEEKKEAIVEFETKTGKLIESEIREQNRPDLDQLKTEHEQISVELKQAEEKVKLFSIEIANRYESFIGKDMMVISKIDTMIELVNSGKATTIAQALAMCKEPMAAETQKNSIGNSL